jgi:anaerobic magnesium-protoporphyrin IX monomethyl ester cyclase
MTKVMLINPPQVGYKGSMPFNVYIPVGLLYIAAKIKDICNLQVLDCLVDGFEIKAQDDKTIYGTSLGIIENKIKKFNPDIVGITVPFSTQLENAIVISTICKKINNKMIVVFGGPDPTIRYEYILAKNYCDYCVVGEGEESFFEFVLNFKNKVNINNIKGVAFRENDKIHYQPREYIKDLDSIPYPNYEAVNLDQYFKHPFYYISRSIIPENSLSLITSRGCPYNCVFCSIKLHMGNKYRFHSVDYVINYIKYCIQRYQIKSFHFEDDNISYNQQRFEAILNRIINEKLNISWDTPNGIRVDSLNYNILKKIKQSGCKNLIIAIESANQYVLDNIINKKVKIKKALEIIRQCSELGIQTAAFYVIGLPGETIQNIRETLAFALELYRKYATTPYVCVATPLFGTELYQICVNRGIINKNIPEKQLAQCTQIFGEPIITTDKFNKDELKKEMNDFYYQTKIMGIKI